MWIYPVQSRALIPYHLYPPSERAQYLLAQFVPLRSSKGTRDIRLRFHDINKGNKAHQGTVIWGTPGQFRHNRHSGDW